MNALSSILNFLGNHIKNIDTTDHNFGNVSVASSSSVTWNEVATVSVTESGNYLIQAVVRFNSNATGGRGCGIAKGSGATPAVAHQDIRAAVKQAYTFASVIMCEAFTAGDVISVRAWQNSGSALTAAVRVRVTRLK